MQRFLIPLLCLLWQPSLAAEATVRLEIANGNGMPGVAQEVARELNDNPFRVVRTGDAPTFKYGQTFILYRQGFAAQAELLAARLPVKGWLRQTGGLDDGVDMRLLLGRDYAYRLARARQPEPEPEPAPAQRGRERANAAAAGPRLEVSNGNGVAGMASRVGSLLREHDYPVFSLTNAESYDYRRSVIYYRPGLRSEARELASILPVGNIRLEQNSRQGADLRLVIGEDFISYDINRLGDRAGRRVAGE